MKTIGIIGGMGPAATIDLFQKVIDLTPARRDQDHIPLIIDNLPQIPDRTSFLLDRGESPLPHILKSANRLENMGADALCMPCNTAHYFVEMIRDSTTIPFLSMVETTLSAVRRNHPKARKIGLLATSGTYKARIYHDLLAAAGLEVVSPREEFMTQVMETIYAVKAGQLSEKIDLGYRSVGLLMDAGADLLIAGCTEIPLMLSRMQLSLPVVDPTMVLAESIVKIAREDR